MKEDTLNNCSNHFSEEVGQDREGPNSLESPDSTHLPARCIVFLEANKCFAILLKIEFQCIIYPINLLPQ